MNFVQSLNIFGIPAKEIPCLTGKGAPTISTAAAVGCLYMDEDTGELYKCTAAFDGKFTWQPANNGSGIHIGTEEPTNENVDVWIDTDEEADEPAGGGGSGSGVDVTADVGQTIIVKAVDGNGKPTAWEAVDYQPRTHWVEAGGEIVHKLDNKFIDAEWMATTEKSIVIPDGSYQNGFGELVLTGKNLETELHKGDTYRVVFEGASYECVAVDPESEDFAYDFGENALILGNARVLEEAYGYDAGAYGEDTGEPFCLAQYGENWDVYLGGEWTEKEAMVRFGVYRVTEVPIKLPEKFLPESLVPNLVESVIAALPVYNGEVVDV